MSDQQTRAFPVGQCYGCGQEVETRTSLFHAGHDKKAESLLIEQKYGGVAEFLLAHGYGPDNPIITEIPATS